jgi:SAM-dependent methyltransferase
MRDNYDGHGGVDRREPKIIQRDYLVLRRLSDLLRASIEEFPLEQDAAILDLGCGNKPYQPFFIKKSSLYVGIDTKHGEFVDVLCSGEKLSFKSNSFLAIVCAQVLEHVEEPRELIDEASRVLKPGGLLFLSTHGNWPVHGSPHDYWRWTEYGLRRMLTNFKIHAIYECGGPASSILQLMGLFVPKRSIGIMFIVLLNKLGDFLEELRRFNAGLPELATNYLAVARKR